MRINLRQPDIYMPKHLLNAPQIRRAAQQMRREAVPQRMHRQLVANALHDFGKGYQGGDRKAKGTVAVVTDNYCRGPGLYRFFGILGTEHAFDDEGQPGLGFGGA